jgi:ribosome recycling factor
MITVSVWDKGMVVSVEKAIRSSDLGLNPWSTARPCAFRSRRSRGAPQGLAKSPASTPSSSESRAQRPPRRQRRPEEGGEGRRHQPGRAQAHGGEVQKLTDEAIKRVDEALKTKEQEIMHV